jgi:flagellar protein FliJ
MSWAESLIRISTYEVDELRKRLKLILDRQDAAEQSLDTLDLEAEEEKLRARVDPAVAWCHPDYLKAWKLRRARVEAELAAITLEAEGARDALAEAFEALKKVEHVAELARLQQAQLELRRENAGLDEIALRNSHRARVMRG